MFAEIKTTKLKIGDILPDLALALASYTSGDASGFYEWYEPLVESGELVKVELHIDGKIFTLEGKDYSGLAEFPSIAVLHRGVWVGDKTLDAAHKFIYDESGDYPVLVSYREDLTTKVFV